MGIYCRTSYTSQFCPHTHSQLLMGWIPYQKMGVIQRMPIEKYISPQWQTGWRYDENFPLKFILFIFLYKSKLLNNFMSQLVPLIISVSTEIALQKYCQRLRKSSLLTFSICYSFSFSSLTTINLYKRHNNFISLENQYLSQLLATMSSIEFMAICRFKI